MKKIMLLTTGGTPTDSLPFIRLNPVRNIVTYALSDTIFWNLPVRHRIEQTMLSSTQLRFWYKGGTIALRTN